MPDEQFRPFRNEVTGLRHHVMPVVRQVPVPKALLFVGNSLFFFNNGTHRMLRQLMAKTPGAPKFRTNMVAINGASLSWHDVESYFRPNAISSYTINAANEVVFRDPSEQLWDSVILLDSTQGPIHPVLAPQFRREAARDAAIVRKHGATPIFYVTWAYQNRPEMTEALADAIITAANENDAIAVPTGLAFALVKERHPDAPIYIEDNRHPSPAGTYLQACVIISALFGLDARTVGTDNGLPADLAAMLRGAAQETVCRFFGRGAS